MLILDRIQYGYDKDGNVLYEKNLGPSGSSAGAPSTVAGTFSQLYHANSAASGDDNTAYDPLGRLTSLRRGALTASANNGGVLDTVTTLNSVSGVSGNQESWSLNAVGGWTSVSTDGTAKTQTTNAQNETTAAQGASLTYDNNGNLTKNAQGDTLKYDAWNRLVNTNSGTGTALEYDALGRWDLDTITSGVNDVYFDMQGHQIETLAGTVYHQYVWGFAYVNEIILRDEHTGSGNNYGMAGSGLNQRLYANQDAEWSTISLVAPGGTVDERMVYDAYGDVNVLTAAWANGSALTYYFRINFQGEYQLSEANVYIMGARDFDYTTGSWAQKDPIGYGDGMNDYQGFGSNPATNVDPTGLASTPLPNPSSPNWGPINPTTGQPTYMPPLPGGNQWRPVANPKYDPTKPYSRPGKWVAPKNSVKVPGGKGGQPQGSWDPVPSKSYPKGHGDLDDGAGNPSYVDGNGNPITVTDAHDYTTGESLVQELDDTGFCYETITVRESIDRLITAYNADIAARRTSWDAKSLWYKVTHLGQDPYGGFTSGAPAVGPALPGVNPVLTPGGGAVVEPAVAPGGIPAIP